ncbi:DUF2304 domain-containing protein [Candidatus Woesearchaeota archaeon]|nr:DUF2304 domain-containing protein [Candidatus Woesearchaeota archaeon]
MILGIQILGLLFGIFMIYTSFVHFKRNEFSAKAFGVWTALWVVFILITLFPALVDPIVGGLDFARRMDFYIVLGFMFLIGVVFLNYTLLRKNQKKLEEVVRKTAFERKK